MRFTSSLALGLGWSATTSAWNTHRAQTYDYIVVGGGPSGIITASRLAETNKKVLLLERGPGPTVATGAEALSWNDTITGVDVPALAPGLGPLGYYCDDTPGTAACVLGGGTSVNYLVFVHPPARDFENWPKEWHWDGVVAPAAARLYERNPGSSVPSADGKKYDQGLYDTFAPFFDQLNWTHVDMSEQPDEKHDVYSYPTWNIKDSVRAGPVRTYLPQAQEKKGFTLRLGAKVSRVLRTWSYATGVEFENEDGEVETAKLSLGGKIVLSAGTLNTPRILFNSGIGPAEQIKAVKESGVKVPSKRQWIDLPVGENLGDHPIFSIVVNTDGEFDLTDVASALNGTDVENTDLYNTGSGLLTQGRHRLIFFTSRDGPDGITRYYQCSCAASGKGQISMTTYMTHGLTTRGRYAIHNNGTAYFAEDPYLQTEADQEAAKSFIDEIVGELTKEETGFSLQEGMTTESILENYTSGIHFVGTAKMGSVVDTNAKVFGMSNLFVTDASIHADLPSGNSQAIVMVVAEAAVERILAC